MRRLGPQDPEEVPQQGFSLVVHHRDRKGNLLKHDPYTLRVIGVEGGGKRQLWERPPGSGNIYNADNEPIGRWEIESKGDKKVGRFMEGAKHVEFIPPETSDQKLAKSLIEKDAKIEQLKKELAAIQAEKDKK